MMEIVNVVASGDLRIELDLEVLFEDLDSSVTQYNPETHPGLHLRFRDGGSLLTLYSSGSYVIMGAKSRGEVNSVYSELINVLEQLNIQVNLGATEPVIRNIICKGDLGREVDLNALAIGLSLEKIEYEPEQSPFLYYWPDEFDCVISIPANGQVVITGLKEKEMAEKAFEFLQEKIESLYDSS